MDTLLNTFNAKLIDSRKFPCEEDELVGWLGFEAYRKKLILYYKFLVWLDIQ